MKTFEVFAQPFAVDEDAFLVISHQGVEDDPHLHVHGLRIDPPAGGANLLGLQLVRTSAQANGVPNNPLANSTAATTWPSQLVSARLPEVTTTGILKRPLIVPQAPGSLAHPGVPRMRNGFRSINGAGILGDWSGSSVIQNIRLAEGEGIAILQPTTTLLAYPMVVYLVAEVRIGTRTYTLNTHINIGAYDGVPWGLFNGSGSGVVAEVVRLYVGLAGEATFASRPPAVRLARVTGAKGGDDATPLARVSSNTVPSWLKVYVNRANDRLTYNPITVKHGIDLYADLNFPQANVAAVQRIGTLGRRLTYTGNTGGVGVATGGPPNNFKMSLRRGRRRLAGTSWRFQDSFEFVIAPSDGVALIASGLTAYADLGVTFLVSYEEAAAPQPGGSGGRKIYVF